MRRRGDQGDDDEGQRRERHVRPKRRIVADRRAGRPDRRAVRTCRRHPGGTEAPDEDDDRSLADSHTGRLGRVHASAATTPPTPRSARSTRTPTPTAALCACDAHRPSIIAVPIITVPVAAPPTTRIHPSSPLSQLVHTGEAARRTPWRATTPLATPVARGIKPRRRSLAPCPSPPQPPLLRLLCPPRP